MLLQRFCAILSNISADLEAFVLSLANNMEAIWAVALLWATCGKLYTLLSTGKMSGWLILCVFMPQKTLGSIFARITL